MPLSNDPRATIRYRLSHVRGSATHMEAETRVAHRVGIFLPVAAATAVDGHLTLWNILFQLAVTLRDSLFVCLFATRHNHIMVPRRCGPIRSAHVILGDITSKSCSFPVCSYSCQYAEILPARHLWLWSCLERLLVLPKPRHNMAHDASRDDRSIATKNHQRPPDWRWP